jgi:hypothetical protein
MDPTSYTNRKAWQVVLVSMCNVKQGLCTSLLRRDMEVSYQLTCHTNHICEDDGLLTLQLETDCPLGYVLWLRQSVEMTNKMQPCNRICYSKVYWRLNMFRAAYHSSSEAPNCICSLWFIYPCGERPLSRLCGNSHPAWTTAGHHMGI